MTYKEMTLRCRIFHRAYRLYRVPIVGWDIRNSEIVGCEICSPRCSFGMSEEEFREIGGYNETL